MQDGLFSLCWNVLGKKRFSTSISSSSGSSNSSSSSDINNRPCYTNKNVIDTNNSHRPFGLRRFPFVIRNNNNNNNNNTRTANHSSRTTAAHGRRANTETIPTFAKDAVVKAQPCCADAKQTFPLAGSSRCGGPVTSVLFAAIRAFT